MITNWDNLKLGYGGTKSEMERLLKDAEKLTGTKFDINNFSDVVEAIHAVQTEMGITGTTAKEAAGTVSGSLGSVKASWQNLLTGFADGNRDMGELMDNFVNSVGAAAKNIIPRVKQAVKSITSNLGDLAGKLVSGFFGEKTGAAVKKTVDTIMSAVQRLLKILEGFSPIIEIAMNFVSELIGNLLPPLMSILETLMPIVEQITGIVSNVLIGAVKILGGALKALEGILKPILDLLSPVMTVLDWAGQGLAAIGDGIGYLLAGCPKVADNFEEVMDAADNLTTSVDKTIDSWNGFVDAQTNTLQSSADEISKIQSLKDELDGLVDGNGKVKKGYEDRAEYVANELSQLTGEEIKIVDGQIQKYDELSKKIEETIQKKKIAALDEYYSGIIQEYGKTAGQDKHDLLQIKGQIDEINRTMSETSKNTDEYNQLLEQRNELNDKAWALENKVTIATQAKIDKEKLWTAVSKNDTKTLNELSKNRLEIIHTENGDYIMGVEDKILSEANFLDRREEFLKRAEEAGDESAAEMYRIQKKESEDSLKILSDEYSQKKTKTRTGLAGMLDLTKKFYINSAIEASKGGQKSANKFTGALSSGISSGIGMATSTAGNALQRIYDALKPNEGKLNWIGEMFLKGIEKGMRTEYAKRTASAASDIGTGLVRVMQNATGVHSPSTKTIWIAEMMLKGLEVGWKRKSKSTLDMINKDMRFSGSMDFSSSISHNSIVGELLKYVKSIDKKSGRAGNVYFNNNANDSIDDFTRSLSRSVIVARRV